MYIYTHTYLYIIYLFDYNCTICTICAHTDMRWNEHTQTHLRHHQQAWTCVWQRMCLCMCVGMRIYLRVCVYVCVWCDLRRLQQACYRYFARISCMHLPIPYFHSWYYIYTCILIWYFARISCMHRVNLYGIGKCIHDIPAKYSVYIFCTYIMYAFANTILP